MGDNGAPNCKKAFLLLIDSASKGCFEGMRDLGYVCKNFEI